MTEKYQTTAKALEALHDAGQRVLDEFAKATRFFDVANWLAKLLNKILGEK